MLINSYFQKSHGMGLGDFIRGSIAAQQLCLEYGLIFQVDLSHHPIGQYLLPRCDAPAPSIKSILSMQDIPNFTVRALKKNLSSIINLKTLSTKNLHIYTNVWPTFKISPAVSNKIKSFFTPNETLENEIQKAQNGIGEYGVIHIRAGDILSFNTQIGDVVPHSLDDIVEYIHPQLEQLRDKNYIVLSDCAALKKLISKKYNFKTTQTAPTHLALKNNGSLDTLIDYFLLTRATHIHQFSVHRWGSGFSDSAKWLYGVPVLKHQLFS